MKEIKVGDRVFYRYGYGICEGVVRAIKGRYFWKRFVVQDTSYKKITVYRELYGTRIYRVDDSN